MIILLYFSSQERYVTHLGTVEKLYIRSFDNCKLTGKDQVKKM